MLDLDVLVPPSSFSGILLVYGLTLLAALALFNLVLSHQVLRPLKNLETAMREAEQGHLTDAFPPARGRGEIPRLIEHFQRMAHAQWEARLGLESKVRERTEALDRLAKTDPLTELLNRRGMSERIEAEISRSRREHSHIGLLLLDIDLFKEINDQHGHGKGDEALQVVARLIHAMLRSYDSVARWGGDEFLVLTQASDAQYLDNLGERILAAVADSGRITSADGTPTHLSISVGGYFAHSGEELESMLQRTDKALYASKEAGRNCYRAYGGGV